MKLKLFLLSIILADVLLLNRKVSYLIFIYLIILALLYFKKIIMSYQIFYLMILLVILLTLLTITGLQLQASKTADWIFHLWIIGLLFLIIDLRKKKS